MSDDGSCDVDDTDDVVDSFLICWELFIDGGHGALEAVLFFFAIVAIRGNLPSQHDVFLFFDAAGRTDIAL